MPDETSANPFKGRVVNTPVPTRVLHRFTNQRHRIAEIRERTVTAFSALEWLLFVDDALIESRLYHGDRASHYAAELVQVIGELKSAGWTEIEPARTQG